MPPELLLNLDGEIYPMEKGFWVKFVAKKVEATPHCPQGVSYSLTLHDRNNTRVLGFDNAHAFSTKRKGFGARKMTWDHKHKLDVVTEYHYESAAKLLEDFWAEVNTITGYK